MAVVTYNAYGTDVQFAPAVSLANAAGYLTAAQGADATGGDLQDDLLLTTAFGTAPTAGNTVDVYQLPAIDGTNYPYGGTSQLPAANLFRGSFILLGQTASQRVPVVASTLTAGLFKYLFWNLAGQTMSSGWTVDRRPNDLKSA